MLEKNRKFLDGSGMDNGFALGRQLTIEYYSCAADILLSKDIVEKALLKAANDSGATIISSSFHDFKPQGVSGVVVIAESHFTVHAWPEHDYAAVDIFVCGNVDPYKALSVIKKGFRPKKMQVVEVKRGVM